MATRQELDAVLRTLPDGVERVEVVGDRTLIATVVSESFSGRNEADRQASVWSYLQTRLDESNLQNIEIILTDAPDDANTSNDHTAEAH